MIHLLPLCRLQRDRSAALPYTSETKCGGHAVSRRDAAGSAFWGRPAQRSVASCSCRGTWCYWTSLESTESTLKVRFDSSSVPWKNENRSKRSAIGLGCLPIAMHTRQDGTVSGNSMKFPLQGHPGAKKEGWCARMLNKQIQTLTTHPADAKREALIKSAPSGVHAAVRHSPTGRWADTWPHLTSLRKPL